MKTNPMSLPTELCTRLEHLLGAEGFRRWCDGARAAVPTAFRVNTLRGCANAVAAELRDAGLTPEPLGFPPDCLVVPAAERRALTETAAFHAGRLYIQSPSSVLAAMLLDPQPGEEVLDLAAAPGGKTLAMAAAMGDRGRIAAVERSRPRFFKLRANCKAQGASCVRHYLADGAGVWRKTPERFDRVLLDAPCSGEARINPADPATWAGWSVKRSRRLAALQTRLLFSAAQCLRPGGRLAYATCTFAPEENEAVVDRLLRRFGAALEPCAVPAPACPHRAGITEWQGRRFDARLARALRVMPEGVWEGFFVAVLEKRSSTIV